MPNQAADHSLSGPLVVVIVYDGLCTFEFGTAYEVFGLPRPEMGHGWYRFCTASVETEPMNAAGGLVVKADGTADLIESADLVIIPGWRAVDAPIPAALKQVLHLAAARGARIATLCSGVFPLASTGLLDGKRATTHWRYAARLAELHPLIEVAPDVLYVDNGQFLTAAGSAAGIDLCVHIVRKDFGVEAANCVARRLVVPPHRDGGQAQFIPRPVPRHSEASRLGFLMDWIEANLDKSLSVEKLAKQAGMSTRTFQRRFEDVTGSSPGEYVIGLRIGRAQNLLESRTDLPLEEVAALSGFKSLETLRHHFRSRIQTSPHAWRAKFGEDKTKPPTPHKPLFRPRSSA
jgi:AraC family transcriptional regulator, transcriptional activator FtrA